MDEKRSQYLRDKVITINRSDLHRAFFEFLKARTGEGEKWHRGHWRAFYGRIRQLGKETDV